MTARIVIQHPQGTLLTATVPLGATSAVAPRTPHDGLVDILARHGLLNHNRGATTPGASVSTNVNRTQSSVHQSHAPLSTAALRTMMRHVDILVGKAAMPAPGGDASKASAPPSIPCDFFLLAVELMRVVREFSTPLRSEVPTSSSSASATTGSETTGASPATKHCDTVVAVHALSKYALQTVRSSLALRVLNAVLTSGKAVLSESDVLMLTRFSGDLEWMSTLLHNAPQVTQSSDLSQKRHNVYFTLAISWFVLAASLQSLALRWSPSTLTSPEVSVTVTPQQRSDVAAIGLRLVRHMNAHSALASSGFTLFLQEAYIHTVVTLVKLLLSAPMFRQHFDNIMDVCAQLLVNRVMQRPTLSKSGTTSNTCPTPRHGALYIASFLRRTLCPENLFGSVIRDEDRDSLKMAVRKRLEEIGAEKTSFFQWIGHAVILGACPLGLTLDPEALSRRAKDLNFSTEAELQRPSFLQVISTIVLHFSGAEKCLSPEALLVMLGAIIDELLQGQAGVESLQPSLCRFVSPALLLRPIKDRCIADPNFLHDVLQKVREVGERSFRLVAHSSTKAANTDHVPPLFVSFGHDMFSALSPVLYATAVEQLSSTLAFQTSLALSWLMPFLMIYALTITDKNRAKEEAKRLVGVENFITQLAARFEAEDATQFVAETAAVASDSNMVRNRVHCSRLQGMMVSLRSPQLCTKIPKDILLREWPAIVLPCFKDSNRPPLTLMDLAHDVLIAPVLAKIPCSLLFIPTYVALFAPLNASSKSYQRPHMLVARKVGAKVRLVAESVEQMDHTRWTMLVERLTSSSTPRKEEVGFLADEERAVQAVQELLRSSCPEAGGSFLKDLHPLSAVLLIVQGVFDNIRPFYDSSTSSPLTKEAEDRKASYLSGLLNLLQCSSPLVTSRVCACVELIVLDLAGKSPAEQTRILKFASRVVQSTSNFSIKKPLGEWLLRLQDEVVKRRGKNPPKSKL